jgi:hypothetical protein
MIEPSCDICQGGCCLRDVKLFGLMRLDLIKLAARNTLIYYPQGSFPDLRALYLYLKQTNAADGIYALENDINDVDGIRLGPCAECVEGKCLIHDNLPSPCKRLEVGSPSCEQIFLKQLAILEP